MKTVLRHVAAIGTAIGLVHTNSAHADFSGSYAPQNGIRNLHGGNGVINTNGAPGSIFMRSANGPGGGGAGNTDFTFLAPMDGKVSFSWSYSTNDTAASFDPFRFLINGNVVATIFGGGATSGLTSGSGSRSFNVASGDTFGFRLRTIDGSGGRARVDITNFSGPVPEPETYLLMGLGTLALAYARRRQQKNKVQQHPPLVGPA